jgi:hypothetical protein
VFRGLHAGVPSTTVFDVGALGLWPNAAHGHADALSVLIRLGNRLILTDPGTGTYHQDANVRNRLRTTAAHNTVTLDGLNQADIFDVFKWVNPWKAWLQHSFVGEHFQYAVASHNGYCRLTRPVVHHRHVLVIDQVGWIIVDYVEGFFEREVARHFTFHPCTTLTARGAASIDVADVDQDVTLRFSFPDLDHCPTAAWRTGTGLYSEKYGHWVEAPRLTVTATTALPVALCTFVHALTADDRSLEVGSCRRHTWTHGAVMWEYARGADMVDVVVFNPQGRRLAVPHLDPTSAGLLFARRGPDGTVHRRFEAHVDPTGSGGPHAFCREESAERRDRLAPLQNRIRTSDASAL